MNKQINKYSLDFAKFSIDTKLKIRSVIRPPTWRNKPYTLSYILLDREIDSIELVDILRRAISLGMPNPRIITPSIARWSSLFHPRFFKSIHGDYPKITSLKWTNKNLSHDPQKLTLLRLQSILFLSSVTLSAAIIQHRFSSGTIGSKLDHLWDAGTLSRLELVPELIPLKLHEKILELEIELLDDVEKLLKIRRIFMEALKLIAPRPSSTKTMKKCNTIPFFDGRFNFIDDLQAQLGNTIQAVIVYGSSISSNEFADIDAIIIAENPEATLLKLAGTSPIWQGKELNLGIYSPSEFLMMQCLSGDNLFGYGICIWGEVEVVEKSIVKLLSRNFSFGVIRQRQQFGMLSRAISIEKNIDSNQQNLYEYFVKIPANVAKGTFGVMGKQLPKEHIHNWLLSTIGFDTPETQKQAISGNVINALALSSIATGHALSKLNTVFKVVKI